MGDLALVDAHILVDPLISVSEGHYIAESARARLLTNSRVVDALIHVDPENDDISPASARLPTRSAASDAVRNALNAQGMSFDQLNLHYLSSGFEIDVLLPSDSSNDQIAKLQQVDFNALKNELGARHIRLARSLRPDARETQHAEDLPR